jgi:hypothetical protein
MACITVLFANYVNYISSFLLTTPLLAMLLSLYHILVLSYLYTPRATLSDMLIRQI